MKSLIVCIGLLYGSYSSAQITQTEISEINLEITQNTQFEQSQISQQVLYLNLAGMNSSDQESIRTELYQFNNYVVSIQVDEKSEILCFKHKNSLPKTSVLAFLSDHGIASDAIINY